MNAAPSPNRLDAVVTPAPGGVRVAVRVIPRARKSLVAGIRDGALLIRLAAPPVDGAANEALVTFFASTLGVPPRAVTLVSGQRSRNKCVAIAGPTVTRVRELLKGVLGMRPAGH